MGDKSSNGGSSRNQVWWSKILRLQGARAVLTFASFVGWLRRFPAKYHPRVLSPLCPLRCPRELINCSLRSLGLLSSSCFCCSFRAFSSQALCMLPFSSPGSSRMSILRRSRFPERPRFFAFGQLLRSCLRNLGNAGFFCLTLFLMLNRLPFPAELVLFVLLILPWPPSTALLH
jgi:hypothetical protein